MKDILTSEMRNKKSVKKTRDKFLDKFSINYLDNLLYSWKQFLLKYQNLILEKIISK